MEVFVLDFLYKGSVTEIYNVMDVTGLSYEEILRACKTIELNRNERV